MDGGLAFVVLCFRRCTVLQQDVDDVASVFTGGLVKGCEFPVVDGIHVHGLFAVYGGDAAAIVLEEELDDFNVAVEEASIYVKNMIFHKRIYEDKRSFQGRL